MRSIITLLMVISIYLSRIMIVNAQSPPMEWHKCYGTDNGEHIHEGMQTSDLGYIRIGQTDESEAIWQVYLVKTGLSIEREDYVFDRFAGRVIFPILAL